MQGRRLRKAQRQIKNSFVAKPCRFHRWRWYDWIFGAFTLALVIYSVLMVLFVSNWINEYRAHATPPGQTRRPIVALELEIESKYYYRVGIPLAVSLLVALFYLLALTIFILIWLRYLRNIGYFVILLFLIFIGIIFYLTIGGVATRNTVDEATVDTFAFDYITEKLSHPNQMAYVNNLYVLMAHYQCCGIRGYEDWEVWNPLIHWPMDPESVPNHCCRGHMAKNNVMAERNECGNMNILKENHHSSRLKKINIRGCGYKLRDEIVEANELWKYALHGFIIGILLLILLLLLLCTMWCLFMGREVKWTRDFRDQEDFAESDIVPGTPLKSMMSESENTFYAP